MMRILQSLVDENGKYIYKRIDEKGGILFRVPVKQS